MKHLSNTETELKKKLCLYKKALTIGTYNSPPLIKTNQLFQIFSYRICQYFLRLPQITKRLFQILLILFLDFFMKFSRNMADHEAKHPR